MLPDFIASGIECSHTPGLVHGKKRLVQAPSSVREK